MKTSILVRIDKSDSGFKGWLSGKPDTLLVVTVAETPFSLFEQLFLYLVKRHDPNVIVIPLIEFSYLEKHAELFEPFVELFEQLRLLHLSEDQRACSKS